MSLGTQRLCSEGLVNKLMFLEHFLYIWSVISNSFLLLHSSFLSGKLASVEKKISNCNNHTLVNRNRAALLACLAPSPGIARICYQEPGYTVANGNMSPWRCEEFSFSDNWKVSCEQTWQDTDHVRQFLNDLFKNLCFCRKTRLTS